MRTNQVDQVIITEDDFVEILYQGHDVNSVVVESSAWIDRYKQMCSLFELSDEMHWEQESTQTKEQYINRCLADWNLPEKYQALDIENYLLSKCTTSVQEQRVYLEMEKFKSRNMIQVLRFLKYFVDTMKNNNMVWGVGRGSSVSSYVLYLLNVHRVDSIAYDLDIKEFLK
jgi:DNA polymerase III alpha subunit